MDFPAASPHRGCFPWLGLLLATFLLTLWIPPTTAQFGIVWTLALEGQDAILRLRNTPPDAIGFIWYKGVEMNYQNFIASLAGYYTVYLTGSEYNGRAEINLDGSLIIRKVTAYDRGTYMVVAVLPNSRKEIAFGPLNVYRE
ncbi:Carcinoembryonic antigen-related cell adhesion molecule 3 [Myotis davidii]|uniref:Carcinoembryonic antigen-related cell adhesion molecule 3 n=1 Tax=Myotis davidii TaxID=225400 RepID=L5M3R9_MYODS|nr:Carcinoembryonic antigen-related cell adhesion molecule 3 [Myotis davidii]